ncbi:hypothetical protein EXIGLDRAFT_96107 [Exidia glandulosa HHB12029]|uniref:Uncharacterized protein n=1 Tax=Exidia glandulosa HHB12029 TaxID=1314781 RepID=A0A165H6I6_EXIGL|nr:hypothetical protein EXIGLDRAFT_96107 [Exidia glandulosa HHB12029]
MDILIRTLRTWPTFAFYIKSIRLPDETWELPPFSSLPRPLAPWPFVQTKRRLWRIGCAVDSLLEQCTRVIEVTFGSNTSNIVYSHRNSSTIPRLTHIHIAGDPRCSHSQPDPLHPPMELSRGFWPHTLMTHMTLSCVYLHWTGDLRFPHRPSSAFAAHTLLQVLSVWMDSQYHRTLPSPCYSPRRRLPNQWHPTLGRR